MTASKVIDLGFHAFDEFFKMTDEIGFMKEAIRRGEVPIILFVADTDRTSARGYEMLQEQILPSALVTIDNEFSCAANCRRPWGAAAWCRSRRCRCF